MSLILKGKRVCQPGGCERTLPTNSVGPVMILFSDLLLLNLTMVSIYFFYGYDVHDAIQIALDAKMQRCYTDKCRLD